MKKSVKCTVLCLIMVCCMVFSLPLTAFASDYNFPDNMIFYMSCVEPPTNANQGYINLLYRKGSDNNDCKVFTYFWTCMSVAGDGDFNYSDDCSVAITVSKSSNKVTLSCYTSIYDFKQMSVGYGRIQNGTGSAYYSSAILKDSLDSIVTFSGPSGYSLIGYQVYGNGIVTSSDFSSSGSNASQAFLVNWGTDALEYSAITDILAQINILAQNDTKIISKLESILSDTSNIDATLLRLEDLLEQLLDAKGESTFEEPSTESISDYNKAEDELVSGADDTSDIEQQIEDFEIDADSSSLIWGIIQGYLNQNELVFGLVVGVLCLGIIALILNR